MHTDHRKRVRKRFEQQGLDAFEEHQVLEMLLFYTIQRKDTNEIAHRLIERFGNLVNVLQAPIDDLKEIEGIGHESALYLNFIGSSYRYFRIRQASIAKEPNEGHNWPEYLKAKFQGCKNEEVHLLCFDAKGKMTNCVKLEEGDICSVKMPVRKLLKTAMAENAVSVILAHNHPGGFAVPSGEDVEATNRLAKMLQDIQVHLIDHIVVVDEEHISFLASGLYCPEATGVFFNG